MAQNIFRLNLNSSHFPLLSAWSGKTVVVPNADIGVIKADGQKMLANSPQLVYCDNVLPTTEGLRAAGLVPLVAAAAPAVATFDEAYRVEDIAGLSGVFVPATGGNYLWKGTTWATIGATVGVTAANQPSHAVIGGESYVLYANLELFKVNVTAGTKTAVVPTGLLVTAMKGITASGNYLVAWDDFFIYWGDPVNPTDFTPSLITGAGSITPTDLRGKIVKCYPALNGFIIYTTQNVIHASFSGNATYPWIFKEVAGASGLRDPEHVTHYSADLMQIMWSASGLQEITAQGSKPVFPEIADFLANKTVETYAAGILSSATQVADLVVRLTRVGQRFFVLSYGLTSLTHALIYDIALQRWGKVTIPHVDAFGLPNDRSGNLTQLCFLAADGTVTQIGLEAGATGVAVFGRVAMTRNSQLTIQGLQVETVPVAATCAVSIAPSYDGVTPQPLVTPYLESNVGGQRKYLCKLTGENHFIHIVGEFKLTCVVLATSQHGVR